MATVVTTGTTIAGLSGLGTVVGLAGALAGAVGLGLAAIAAKVLKDNDEDEGYYGGGGYRGGGGGHGGGGGGYGGGESSGGGTTVYIVGGNSDDVQVYEGSDSSGGGGHGSSDGGSSGYRRRKARSIEDESESLKRLMEVIRSQDVTGCGKRLVCELSAVQTELLSEEELSILNLVGPSVVPGEGVLPGSALWEYKNAGEFGKTVGNCAAAFPMCPLNGAQLMDQVMSYLP